MKDVLRFVWTVIKWALIILAVVINVLGIFCR